MPYTFDDLTALINSGAQEGFYLEFKRGAALDASNEKRKELVKDCTAFANADGGTIIYGLEEADVDGVNVAAGFSPIANAVITKEWIGEVLRAGSSPPLNRYEISELNLPDGSGRVIILEIQPAQTAHQNLRDHRYYQRSGVVTSPMVDFQIRDLMSRRTRPTVEVTVATKWIKQSTALHRYKLAATIKNSGTVTVEKWWMEIDIPRSVVRDTRTSTELMSMQTGFHLFARSMTNASGDQIMRISFGDPNPFGGSRKLLHPGQSAAFDNSCVEVIVEVDDAIFDTLSDTSPAIEWRVFLPNSPPFEGQLAFTDWCRF